jgi:CheY-like chemotaxis protein
VDDAADTRLILNLRLQREGYTVYTAEGGREALETIRREGLPNLVLLDIMMPDMDGFAVAAELRRMGDIPIIFLSALSDVDTNGRPYALRRSYVTKPLRSLNCWHAFGAFFCVLVRSTFGRDDHRRTAAHQLAKQYAAINEQITLTPTENRI